jgi:hypothetical protein
MISVSALRPSPAVRVAAERQTSRAAGEVAVRVWLQQGHDGDPGVEALGPDLLGFATWARSEAEVVEKLPSKLREYSLWRSRHRMPIDIESFDVDIAGRFHGDEILLPSDLEPAKVEEIDLAIRLLSCSRADLVAELESAPEGAIDWDPPYDHFAPWATWRTIRANLAHIANGETQYYMRNIGHTPSGKPADADGDWRDFLPRSRREAVAFLERLKASRDLRRIRTVDRGLGEESWSVRKALRRIVSHELLHSKSIRRIIREYRARASSA